MMIQMTTTYRLTPREQDVAELMAEGQCQSEIARRLIVTVRTVRKHEAIIKEKLGVSTRFQAAVRLYLVMGKTETTAMPQ